MWIRLFIFGLIAIVTGDKEATLLFLDMQDHTPYIAFDKGTCPDCPNRLVYGHGINGYVLEKKWIVLDAVTVSNQDPAPPIPAARPTVPQSSAEARDFYWVPAISTLDSAANPRVPAKCLSEPLTCGHPIAAEMQITNGTLQTCRLIETRNGWFSKNTIHGFDFVVGSSPASQRKQAMADVVELDAPIAKAKSLTLTLVDFDGKADNITTTLFPEECTIDKKPAKCVDIFLGNITDTSESASTPQEFVAPHFKEYFDLFPKPVTVYSPALNDPNSSNNTAKTTVQPECKALPGTGVSFRHWLTTTLKRSLISVRDIPASRPLCPPAALAQ